VIEIRRAPIDVDAVLNSVRREDAGAIVVFLGTVRAEGDVRTLDYEVYAPMARKTFADLVDRGKAKFGVLEMSIVHRVGRVPVRGDSVAVACSAAHRAEAFAACAWAMDEIKRIVPIWKTEHAARNRRPASQSTRRRGAA